MLGSVLRELLGRRREALAWGLGLALLLAVPDVLRQLPVREGASLEASLLVDAVGVVTAALVQVALVGLLAGAVPRRWLSYGVRLLARALRRHPGLVVAGLVAAGAVSALVTLVPSVALLGYDQVLGPLDGPPVSTLLLAQLSDVVATGLTAPWFALLVARAAGETSGGRRRTRR